MDLDPVSSGGVRDVLEEDCAGRADLAHVRVLVLVRRRSFSATGGRLLCAGQQQGHSSCVLTGTHQRAVAAKKRARREDAPAMSVSGDCGSTDESRGARAREGCRDRELSRRREQGLTWICSGSSARRRAQSQRGRQTAHEGRELARGHPGPRISRARSIRNSQSARTHAASFGQRGRPD